MNTLQDRRIDPSEITSDILRQLSDALEGDPTDASRPTLIRRDGTGIELPQALNDLLVYVVHAMERKQAIFFMPEDEAFTTQAAADFLGMSRPYLLRILEAGEIPFHRVGTHRRIRVGDLCAFRDKRDKKRRETLDALTKKIDQAGLYDRF